MKDAVNKNMSRVSTAAHLSSEYKEILDLSTKLTNWLTDLYVGFFLCTVDLWHSPRDMGHSPSFIQFSTAGNDLFQGITSN